MVVRGLEASLFVEGLGCRGPPVEVMEDLPSSGEWRVGRMVGPPVYQKSDEISKVVWRGLPMMGQQVSEECGSSRPECLEEVVVKELDVICWIEVVVMVGGGVGEEPLVIGEVRFAGIAGRAGQQQGS